MLADPAIQLRLPLGRNKQISIYLSKQLDLFQNAGLKEEHSRACYSTEFMVMQTSLPSHDEKSLDIPERQTVMSAT